MNVKREHWKFDPKLLWSLVTLSATAVLQFLIATPSWSGLVMILAGFGTFALAGYQIGLRVIMYVLLPAVGLANAAATLVGQNLEAVLRGMIRRRGGVVLFMGSLAGVRMLEAPIHYCASKAALSGLSDALSKEVSRYGVRVLCLAPGLLEDGLGKNLPDARLRDYLHHCSLGRVGTFREVADWAVFLTSGESSYLNGTTVVLDGGV